MQSSIICIFHTDVICDDSNNFAKVIKFPHPTKIDEQVQYLIANDTFFELQMLNGNLSSSWFIDNNIHKDGSLYMATPIDPLFMILPLLELHRKKSAEHAGYFCTLDQILSQTITDINQISSFMKIKHLNLSFICDIKDIGDQQLFRLNDTKVLKWLRCKVENTRTKLSAMAIVSRAQAKNFIRPDKRIIVNNETDEILNGALAFISEYITKPWKDVLYTSYGLLTNNKSDSCTPVEDSIDRKRKHETDMYSDLESTPKKQKVIDKKKLCKAEKKCKG